MVLLVSVKASVLTRRVGDDVCGVVQLDSGNLLALELRAKAYYHLGEYDMAQTHYREALKFDPEHKVGTGKWKRSSLVTRTSLSPHAEHY